VQAIQTRVRRQAAGHRTIWEVVLVALDVVVVVAAAGGAWGLISGTIDASSYLSRLPFESTAFAGWALALIVAVPATVAALGSLGTRRWARSAQLAAGSLLVGWIVAQVFYIGLASWLQPAMLALGLAIVAIAYFGPSTRKGKG
jgi:hypothetical protein